MPPKAKKRKAANGGAAAVSAESAVRASTRRGAGTNNSAANAAQAARDEVEKKRHERDLATATKQSRRDAFAKEESTQVLWAWGADCEGWKLAHTATRTQVLDGLVKIGAPPISDRKVFVHVMFRGRDSNKPQEGSGGSSGTFKHTETQCC